MSTSIIEIAPPLTQPKDTSLPNFPRVAKGSTGMMMGRVTIEGFEQFHHFG